MQNQYKRVVRYIYFCTAFLFLFTIPANAYIDPSVMTYAIQALAGIAIALGTFFGLYWRKIRKPILHFFNLDETAGKETESDDLVYFDPSVMEKERKIITEKTAGTQYNDSPKQSYFRQLLIDLIPALFITLAGCFMVCIYAPLDLYLANKTEFWYDAGILLTQQLRMFCVVVPGAILFYLICRLISKKLYSCALFATTAVLICAYIQGNFRIKNLPGLDGREVDWRIYGGEDLITVLICAAVIAALLFIYKYVREKGFHAVSEVISCLLTVIMAISLCGSWISSKSVVKDGGYTVSTAHQLDVSDTENFYILVLDAVDADQYRKVSENHPEYSEWFEDFTFFPNTTSVYPFTSRAIPQILSGYAFENEKDFTEFATDALDNSPFLKTLEEQGYQMGIYEPELTYNGNKLDRFDNINIGNVKLNPEAKNTFVKEQFKLVLFKYLPYYFKKYVNCDTNIFASMMGDAPFLTYNYAFYRDLLNNEVTHMTDKNFRFYHVEGAHTPFKYDKDVNVIPMDQGTYTQNIEASMKVASTFINKLKEAGVYENSSIMIMADHGYQDADDIKDRFNPLLMVKGFGEKHSYNISEAPISYFDLPEAYSRLLDHKTSEDCFDAKEGDYRVRRLLFLEWLKEDYIQECTQDGYAADYQNIKLTGNEYRR